MLINFSVSNLLSFGEKITFSMVPGQISKQHTSHVVHNGFAKALKGACIYGANASGKTNCIAGVAYLKSLINGASVNLIANTQFKLNNEKNTAFTLDFSMNGALYRYELITDGSIVIFEQYATVDKDIIMPIFTRKKMNIDFSLQITKSESYEWYKNRTVKPDITLISKLREDALISYAATITDSVYFVDMYAFIDSLEVLSPSHMANPALFNMYLSKEDFKFFLLDLLHTADVGISDISWVNISDDMAQKYYTFYITNGGVLTHNTGTIYMINNEGDFIAISYNDKNEIKGFNLKTSHNGVWFDLKEESAGTMRLIELSTHFFMLQHENICLLIDEIDCRLHPTLTRYLIQSHMQNKNQQGQLITTLHDVSLMDKTIWRSDEIWFTEKRVDGSTNLYSLYQFRPRFDKNLQNGYMQGMYGAINIIESGK